MNTKGPSGVNLISLVEKTNDSIYHNISAAMVIPTQQTRELSVRHVFQSTSDSESGKGKTKQSKTYFIKL